MHTTAAALPWYNYLASFGIGALGSGVILFGAAMGLAGFEKTTQKLLRARNCAVYLVIGGLLAAVLQLQLNAWAPLQALAVGAGWPAVIANIATANTVRADAADQLEKIRRAVAP